MHVRPAQPAAPAPLTDPDRARDRLNRVAPPPPQPGRERRDAGPRHGTGKRGGFRLGWGGWLLVEAAAVAAIAAAVLVWPPASACRDQEAKMGFYAGDTLGKCIRRGVAARIDTLDQELKMAVRGSGK